MNKEQMNKIGQMHMKHGLGELYFTWIEIV